MKLSLIITVKNEASHISALLDALLSQTKIPDEIIISDAGSTDATVKIIHSYQKKLPLKLLSLSSDSNRAVGRNRAAALSKGDLLLFTDSGCLPDSHWVAELSAALRPPFDLMSGLSLGKYSNTFEHCVTLYTLIPKERINPTAFLPATRNMAITRKTWNRSGGFDERLRYGEDYAFARKIKRLGLRYGFTPKAVVSWIPRSSLISFFTMLTEHARGDATSRTFRPKVALLFLRYLIFLSLLLLSFYSDFFSLLFIFFFGSYLAFAIGKFIALLPTPLALFYLPFFQLAADIAVMLGTLQGLLGKPTNIRDNLS